jgi:hypothetical protein
MATFMSNSLQSVLKERAETQEGRTFEGAAFSKTWLFYLFSLVVGHGAPHRRHVRDGGRRRGLWSG